MLLVKAVRKADHAAAGAWDAVRHPRDARGRFIDVGHKVTLRDGRTATVIGLIGRHHVDVRTAAGKVERVAANTLDSPAGHGGGLAGMSFPRGRKLTVTHGKADTPLIGHVTNTGTHLEVQPARGGPVHRIPHAQVNRVYETGNREGRPGTVRYAREGWQPGHPASRPAPQLSQVRARDVQPGDRLMLPHPGTGEPAPATVLGRENQGDSAELDIRHDDGTGSYYLADRSAWLDKLDSDTVFPDETETTPDPLTLPPVAVRPLPDGTTVARPVLYTYQRQKITALNLDRDRTLPPQVIQAAARIRQRQPLSAAQAAALSAALRSHATAQASPVQRRSLERAAWRLDAAAAEAHGIALPEPPGTRRAVPVTPAGITEGDHIVVADAAGKLAAVKVRGITPLMGGRLVLADLEHDDGTTETRTLTGRTRAWLIPDRPDDMPVPPQGSQLEHITPDRLRPGDTIRVAAWQGDKSRTAVITAVASAGPDGVKATLQDGGQFTYTSEDGGPAVIRTARGEASQDQPWDSPLPDGAPVTVSAEDLKIGDRIHVSPGTETGFVGTVQELDRADDGATFLRLRGDDSDEHMLEFEPGDTVARLAEGDANAGARIAEARAAREQAQRARGIESALTAILADFQSTNVYHASNIVSAGAADKEIAPLIGWKPLKDRVSEAIAKIGALTPLITDPSLSGQDAAAARMETEKRLRPLITELAERQQKALAESLTQASAGIPAERMANTHDRADPAGPLYAARNRVLAQWRNSPPPQPLSDISRLLAQAASGLTSTQPGSQADASGVPVLPDGASITKRMRAYRAALPADHAHIGHQAVTRTVITAPRLADLEAGKAPGTEQAQLLLPDRAPDGGPGAIAMRHLDIVMAAGRDLDAELQAAIRAAGHEPETPDRAKERTGQIGELNAQQWNASRAAHRLRENAQEEYANAHGFRNYMHLTIQHARHNSGYNGDPEEAQRLRTHLQAAKQAGREASAEREAEALKIGDQLMALREQEKNAAFADADSRRAAALTVLGKVRADGLGGKGARYKAATGKKQELTGRSELVQAMRWAEQHFPASWLARYRDHAPGGYSLGPAQRGFYSDSKRETRLSKGQEKVTGSGDRGRVAIHEAGHAMEQAVPGLRALQDAYLWSRTSQGETGSRTREKRSSLGPGESAYKDGFPEPYSGKDYPNGGKDGLSHSYELLTTGLESLFAGSPYLDDSFRQWLLGTLALVD